MLFRSIKVTVTYDVQKLKPVKDWKKVYYWNDYDELDWYWVEYIKSYTKDVGNIVTRTKTVTTDADGYYKVPVTLSSYRARGTNYYEYITDFKVTFYYNGVEYITSTIQNNYIVSSSTNSTKRNNASEIASDRTTFNDKFSLIKLNRNISDEDHRNELAYDRWIGQENKMGTSKLKIAIDGSTDRNYYRMSSTTGNIGTSFDKYDSNQNIRNVCLALNGRYLDLAVSTNVDHTKVSIKGYETTYNYGDVTINTTEQLTKWLDSVLAENKVNVDIYPTDYYYRITDYLNSGALRTDENISKAIANMTPDELEVEVTFKVEMFNQSSASADVRELAYYYNSNYYTLKGINSKADGTGRGYTWANASNSYGIPTGYTGIVISGEWDVSNNNSQYLYLTFSLNKDTQNAIKLGDISGNIVAITSYHTTAGLLDWDSSTRPITSGSIVQWEDDTARSENVNVRLTSEIRKISGYVFEDANLDGILNNGDTKINDIVIQLIEIKKYGSGTPREIITQETKVDSNLVTTISNGYKTERDNEHSDYIMYKYENIIKEGSGGYEFYNITPGNYIVRFLYGDGYNYDIEPNNTKYNGFDYKSTKDQIGRAHV